MNSDLRSTADIERVPPVTFTFDGSPIVGYPGESVAAALLAQGVRLLRRAHRDAQPRGAFCLMGACQECVVAIAGRRIESCRAVVHAGLEVTSVRMGAAP